MMKKLLVLFGTILSLSACGTTSNQEETPAIYNAPQSYDETFKRFMDNVSIKEKGQYSITYQYKDVRVDDIALLAARYCDETYAKPAHLKDVTLHKNNYRLATFYCHDLQ